VDSENVSIHLGDSTGPVLATAPSFQGKDGITEIQLPELSTVVPLRHKHPSLPLMQGHAFFKVYGKTYQWKKHNILVEEGTNVVLAKFYPSKGGSKHKLGELLITAEGQEMAYLAVITCLIDQERSDERKWKVLIRSNAPTDSDRNLKKLTKIVQGQRLKFKYLMKNVAARLRLL